MDIKRSKTGIGCEYAICQQSQGLGRTARYNVLTRTRFMPPADWKHRIRRAQQLSTPPRVAFSDQPGAGGNPLETALSQRREDAERRERRRVASCRAVAEVAEMNTHWGSYVFSLSPFLPRTGLTAHKTSQHRFHLAGGAYIPVRPANDNH